MKLEQAILLTLLGVEVGVYLAYFMYFLLSEVKGRNFRRHMALLCLVIMITILFDIHAHTSEYLTHHNLYLDNISYLIYLLSIPFDINLGFSILAPQKSNRWLIKTLLISEIFPITTLVAYSLTGLEWIYQSQVVYIVVYIAVMMWILFRLYFKYEKAIKNNYSDLSGRSARWILKLMSLFIFIMIIEVGFMFFDATIIHIIEASINIIIIIVASYYVGNQLAVDYYVVENEETSTNINNQNSQTESAGGGEINNITIDTAEDAIPLTYQYSTIAQKLKDTFEKERQYLQADITTRDVARMIGTNERYLSFFLNNMLGQTFHSYVCGLRLEYARQLIENNPNMQLTDVAYKSGFNSHNTFSVVFKREFNVSPRTFQQECAHGLVGTSTTPSEQNSTETEPETQPHHTKTHKAGPFNLNARELRVCKLILQNLSNEQIAEELNVSRDSLRVIKSRILKKVDPNRQYHDLKSALDSISQEINL